MTTLFNRCRQAAVGCAALAAMVLGAQASSPMFVHQWQIVEVFSSADGNVQFIRMHCPLGATGEIFTNGQQITSTGSPAFTFNHDLSGNTSDKDLLIGTANLPQYGGPTPDFFLSANFIRVSGGTVQFPVSGSTVTFGPLPTNGFQSVNQTGAANASNNPRNYATGATGTVNAPVAACCNGSNCTLTVQFSCTGTWFVGAACGAGNPCVPPPPTGRCCNGTSCSVVTQAACGAGAWTQDADCTGSPCGPTGRCCNGQSCSVTTQAGCPSTWTLAGTCAGSPCTIGHCCVAGSCTIGVQSACTTGTWSPIDTCSPNSCPAACCAGSICTVTTAANCTGANTSFLSAAAACNAAGNNKVPCCRADYNHDGNKAVTDIFTYLVDWFAGSLRADFVNNGTLAPGVDSIFAYLAAWFAGC